MSAQVVTGKQPIFSSRIFAQQTWGVATPNCWSFVRRVPKNLAETNFCANGSKPRNTGVVGTVGGPLVPTTPSDPGLLHFSKKLIFPPCPQSKFSQLPRRWRNKEDGQPFSPPGHALIYLVPQRLQNNYPFTLVFSAPLQNFPCCAQLLGFWAL